MAEITPLRFKKDASWEGENELPEYYTDADKRAGLLDLMSKINAEGNYVFDSKTWEDHRKEYTELLAAYRKAEDDYSKWKSEQEAKGIKATQYLQDDKASEFRVAINERETELNSRFSAEKQRILNGNNPEVSLNLLQVYGEVEKDLAAHPELKGKFADLERIVDNMLESGRDPGKDKSNLNLQYKDGQLLLRVDNLGGSGLKFAIKDDLSIVFTENQTLTKEQVQEFSKFFDDMGMSIDSFTPTDKLKVVDDKDSGKEIGSFEDIFKSYSRAAWRNMDLEELRRIQAENEKNGIVNEALDDVVAEKTIEEEYAGQDYDADGQTGQTSEIGGTDAPSYEGNPFADELQESDKNVRMSKMKGAIMDRAGIMGIHRRCITTRRMPDGSMVISFYGSEQDKMNDGKLDKDGIAKHTKKCSFRMWNTRPPRVGIYVPQGAKFEGGYAKGALGAMKACGYKYFEMSSAKEFGGDAFSVFLDAAGDQLMVPLCKRSKDDPKGCKLDADHWRIWAKAIDDAEKGSKKPYREVLEAKMRAVGEIKAQLSWDTENDELKNMAKQFEGDVRMFYFQKNILSKFDKYISDGINNKGWNDIDTACAYKALAKVAEAVDNGHITCIGSDGKEQHIKYKYLNPDSNALDTMFVQQMALARPNVLKEIENSYQRQTGVEVDANDDEDTSTRYQTKFKQAVKEVKKQCHKELAGDNGALGEIKSAYGKSEVCKGLDVKEQNHPDKVPPFGGDRHPLRNLKEPDLSHISSNAQAQYNNARRTAPTPTRGGYTGR